MKHHIFNKVYLTALLFFAVFASNVYCYDTQQEKQPQTQQEVGIEEKLDQQIPLDAGFFDESGQAVNLKSLINKPTILMLVYYRCPGICSPLMNSVSGVVDKLDMEPGKDYNLISISFDPTETYVTAAPKKFNYFDQMTKKIPDNSWRFLTGDSINIAKVTNAVGFHFKKQGNDYMHGTTIIVLSPEGKVARYLYGTDFLPLDVKLALTEAAEGRTGPGINKLLKICFAYDPVSGKYVLSLTRIIGGGMMLAIIVFVLVLTVKKKKHNLPVNGAGKVSI